MLQFTTKKRRERAMLMRMAEVGRLVERAERSALSAITATVDVLRRDLPDIVRLELRLDRLTTILSSRKLN